MTALGWGGSKKILTDEILIHGRVWVHGQEIKLAAPGLPVLLGDMEKDSSGRFVVCWRPVNGILKATGASEH